MPKKELTIQDFHMAVVDRLLAEPTERPGQAFFNILHKLRPDLSEQIRATALDPFYEEIPKIELLQKAVDFIQEHWEDKVA